MSKLIYSLTTSLDGFVADKDGNFEWTEPSDEVLHYFNRILHNVGTFLLGRNMHTTLAVWDTLPTDGPNDAMNDFAKIWRAADKVVYSSSPLEVSTNKTTAERRFDPETIQQLKLQSDKDFNIGGPHLAAEAIRAGLIDEYHQFIVPIIIGGGNSWLPKNAHLNLELVDVCRFENGSVHLQYNSSSIQ